MTDLASVAGTAAGAFVGTNIDDFAVLLVRTGALAHLASLR